MIDLWDYLEIEDLVLHSLFAKYTHISKIALCNFTDTIVNKISSGGLKTNSVDLDDDEDGGTDSAQDLEGSADQPLDF